MNSARARTKNPAPLAAASYVGVSYAWVSTALSLATLVALIAILRHTESLPSLW